MKNHYRRKPFIVKALQWTGDNIEEFKNVFILQRPYLEIYFTINLDYNILIAETSFYRLDLEISDWLFYKEEPNEGEECLQAVPHKIFFNSFEYWSK